MKPFHVFAATCLSAVLCSIEGQAGFLYGVSAATNSVYELNTATGAATLVTPIVGGSGFSFGGAEILNGQLYVSGEVAGGLRRFGTVNLNTGAFSVLNNMGGDSNWWGLAADAATGRIYTVDSDGAGTLTPKALKYTDAFGAAVTTVGNLSGAIPALLGVSGLAHNDATGTLYGVGQNTDFYSINKTTAVVTLIGTMAGLPANTDGLAGLAFDQQTQVMYLTSRDASSLSVPSSLYTVNLSTGAVTLVGATGINTIEALAWSPTSLTAVNVVPEPSSFALLAAGGLIGAVRLHRRRSL